MYVSQNTIYRGRRWSTANAFLRPAMHRANLEVETKALAHRVRLSGNRAVGLTYSCNGETHEAEAANETIVSCGAIGSPQLLLLSGIGDPEHLKAQDIPVSVSLPGVGRHLQDHVKVMVQYSSSKPVSMAKQLSHVGRAKLGAEWWLFKSGLGTTSFFEVGGFVRTSDEHRIPNLQYEFLPMIGRDRPGQSDPGPRISVLPQSDAPAQPGTGHPALEPTPVERHQYVLTICKMPRTPRS